MTDATGTVQTFVVTASTQNPTASVGAAPTTFTPTIAHATLAADGGAAVGTFQMNVAPQQISRRPFAGYQPYAKVTCHHYDHDWNYIGEIAILDNSASWTEPVSEAGTGTVDISIEDFYSLSSGDLLQFRVGHVPAWTALIGDYDRTRVTSTIGARKVTMTLDGHMTIFQDAMLYPAMGLNAWPTQVDMFYDWRAFEYDDSSIINPWESVVYLTNYQDASTLGALPGIWGVYPWNSNSVPHNVAVDNPSIIGPHGATIFDAPVGKWYVRHRFTVPWDGTYLIWLACDNRATAYVDGVPVGQTNQGGFPVLEGFFDQQQPFQVKMDAGEHMFALECENLPPFSATPGNNPTGVAYACYIPGFPLTPSMLMFSSSGSMRCRSYPPQPLGMTIGAPLLHAMQHAQAMGDIPEVTWDFDEFYASDGDAWWRGPADGDLPTVSTKVMNDLFTMWREVSATYCDLRMDPSSWTLHAYRHNGMNTVDNGWTFNPGDLDPDGNLEGQSQRGTFRVKNVVIGVTQNGYIPVQDDASVSTYGRKPVRLELGAIDNIWEAFRVINKALATYAHEQEEITVQVAEPPYGYRDYLLGEIVTTTDKFDNTISRRVVGIAVKQDNTGRARTTPILGDMFLA